MNKLINVGKFIVIEETPVINEEYQTFKVHSVSTYNKIRKKDRSLKKKSIIIGGEYKFVNIKKCVFILKYNGLEFLKSNDFLLLKEFYLEEEIDELLKKIKTLFSGKKLSNKVPGDPCSECDGIYLDRVNKNTGEVFLGCSNYPNCKSSLPLVVV